MYAEFLYLCGFASDEMKEESPRVERAFEIAGIGAEDVKRAEERLKRYYDVRLNGVRKLLGIWVKEFVENGGRSCRTRAGGGSRCGPKRPKKSQFFVLDREVTPGSPSPRNPHINAGIRSKMA